MNSATSSAADPVTTNTFQQAADAVTFSSTPASRWASCRSHDQKVQAARRVANGARRDRTGLAQHLLGVLMGVRVLARVRPERPLLEGVINTALALLDARRRATGGQHLSERAKLGEAGA